MSKIDELRETYTTAYEAAIRSYDYDDDAAHCIAHAERAGIAAVVRALRDHFCAPVHVQHHFNWAMHDLRFAFDQILGDAGEKVAGNQWTASTQPQLWAKASATDPAPDKNLAGALQWEDVCRSVASLPDPAPAVCEWTRADKSQLLGVQWWSVGCASNVKHDERRGPCPICGKQISLTEAQR